MDGGRLTVPGAEIYYEVRGSGPALLLINGGDGDAALYGPLAGVLAEDYTVITYDPRGNSHSPLSGPAVDQRIEEHANDAHLLLREVADGPACVFGNSYGGMVGMDLLARHPEQVEKLVAHEPFVIELLSDADEWHAVFQEVYEIYQADGVGPALERFSSEVGIAGPPEPTAEHPPEARELLTRLYANLETCIAYELRSFVRFKPDLDRLYDAPVTVAAAAEGRETLTYRTAAALAEHLGTPVVDFPGDHVAFLTRPVEFAGALRDVLRT